MDFSFDDRQQQVAHRYREIGLTHARREHRDGFDWEAWQAITDAGLWRVPVSRDLGGGGGEWFEFTAAFEALAGTMRSIGFSLAWNASTRSASGYTTSPMKCSTQLNTAFRKCGEGYSSSQWRRVRTGPGRRRRPLPVTSPFGMP